MKYDVIIIGAGIIGAAIARELGKYNLNVVVIEKNQQIAIETTAVNSGLIHGGFDPKPGSLSAQLNIEGKELYKQLFKQLNFPHQKVNSILIAFADDELQELALLYKQGIANGLKPEEMKILTKEEVLTLEPHISSKVLGGFLCSTSYIIDPVQLSKQLIGNFLANGSKNKLILGSKVIAIKRENKFYQVITDNDNEKIITGKVIINCAGHWADEIERLAGFNNFNLSARRGQYLILEKSEANKVNNVIFMVPGKYGKGVIVAPLLDGHVMVGPTAQELDWKVDRNFKQKTMLIDLKINDQIAKIGKRIIPDLDMNKIVKIIAGSRAINYETNEFIIDYADNKKDFINVAGIKSPGISAAPAIAKKVINLLKQNNIELIKKNNWDASKILII